MLAALGITIALAGYLGGSGTDDCDGITTDRAGDIYLACHSDSGDFPGATPPRGNMDAVVVKIDAHTGRLVWSTRTGGREFDGAFAIRVATDGSIWVAGITRSPDFPTTAGALQHQYGGGRGDVFLLKLDSSGTIRYATFLGGSKSDAVTGLEVAPNGVVYVSGTTNSPDFPGKRLRQFGPGGEQDGFIVRFDPRKPGSLETVLIGGKGEDRVTAIALSPTGDLFVAGITFSQDFPLKNALRKKLGGKADGFLAKLHGPGLDLEFATYFGGSGLDAAWSLRLDQAGNPVISGITDSPDLPTTARAFQPSRRGPMDAFVAKFDSAGRRVLWCTYFGGSKDNSSNSDSGGVAIDADGRVWITGATASTDLPLVAAHQAVPGGGESDAYIAAFSADGSRLCYASYHGGPAFDYLEGVTTNGRRIYASGLTASTTIPQTRWAVQPKAGGGQFDAMILVLEIPADFACR